MKDKILRNKIEYYCRQYYNKNFLEDRRTRIVNLKKVKNDVTEDYPTSRSPILSDMPKSHGNGSSVVEDFVERKDEKLSNIDYSISRELDKIQKDINIIESIDDTIKELSEVEYLIFLYKFRESKTVTEICYLVDRDRRHYYMILNNIYSKILEKTNI